MPGSKPIAALAAAGLLALSGCSGDSTGSDGTQLAVSASDQTCEVARTKLPAGPVTLDITNDGSQVTEVYVYGKEGGQFTRIIGEREDIGPGTSSDLSVELSPGTYEVACKPGQTGDGIRQRITVTSERG